jgi:hypothetical protein
VDITGTHSFASQLAGAVCRHCTPHATGGTVKTPVPPSGQLLRIFCSHVFSLLHYSSIGQRLCVMLRRLCFQERRFFFLTLCLMYSKFRFFLAGTIDPHSRCRRRVAAAVGSGSGGAGRGHGNTWRVHVVLPLVLLLAQSAV